MASLGAENHGFAQVVRSQADSQFEPTGQPAYPSSQFGSTRAIRDVSFNRPVEVASPT
jgi:hypothetical protein